MSKHTPSDFDEFNTAITRAVENAALHALTIVDRPECWFIAIPLYIQRVMVRHYRRNNFNHLGEIDASKPNTIFADFMGFKVVPGYEMKIVVYHPDAVLYNDPDAERNGRGALYATPITIDRSVPGRIVITAGNETVNLTEP